MICPNCGYQNLPDAHFCQQCGAELPALPESELPVSAMVTRPLSDVVAGRADSDSLPVTEPLPDLKDLFEPLPVGALIQKRYVVKAVEASGEQVNIYRVEDLIPARQCTHCGMVASEPQQLACPVCGRDMSKAPVKNLHYTVQESADPQAFSTEAQWLEMGVAYPGLILPLVVFVESPYGAARSYRVEPELSFISAAKLPLPQEVNTVLTWGTALAQAMSYLHQNRIALRAVNLSHIVIVKKRAFWVNFNRAHLVPAEEQATIGDVFARDVQALASTLLYLATGRQQLNAEEVLPQRMQDVLARAITRPQMVSAALLASQLNDVLQELRHPQSITLAVGYRSDVGQSRSLNEDSLLALDVARVYRSLNQPVGIFVVADGMGGHQAGDVASQMACRTLAQMATHEVLEPATAGQPLPDVKAWLVHATQAANQAVHEHRESMHNDMGTTLVMAFVVGDTATVANVGDSRCYHLSADAIAQVTTDHSLVERLVVAGQITREEAAHHPQKNVIYRVIGDKLSLDVDLFDRRLAAGEALLLCSDGLSGMVSDRDIWTIWQDAASPQEACDRLIEAANQAGGSDNITAVIVQVA